MAPRRQTGREPGYIRVSSTKIRQVRTWKITRKSRYLKLRSLVLSMCGRIQESGLTEVISLMCISALWGQHPVILILRWESRGAYLGVHSWGSCSSWWLDGCSILCLLMGQMTFVDHTSFLGSSFFVLIVGLCSSICSLNVGVPHITIHVCLSWSFVF